jgi:hypothetical protein
MVKHAGRELKVGLILDRTMAVLEANIIPGIIYVVVFGALGAATTYFSLGAPIRGAMFQILVAVATMIGAFVLLEVMLKRSGLLREDRLGMFLPFIGMSILVGIAVGLGFLLIIIPGLVFMARWSICQPVMLVEKGKVFDSMRKSWEMTRGNEFPIILAMLALMVVFVGASIGVGFALPQDSLLGISLSQFLSNVTGVISTAIGVALYQLIIVDEPATDVFS